MTSEGRKRKRSESPDAALSPAQLSTAQPEHPEQPERAEQPGYTDVDLPATAQAYKDVDHPTTRQAYEDVNLPTTPPDIPLVHTRARSTLSLIDEPTFPLTEEPTLPLTEESYLQRSALSPAQLSLARPESAEQPGFTDVDQPTTPPAVSSVHTPSEPTVPLTEAPHLHRSLQSPAQLSPTQLAYTDVDLPATPPALSPVHTPVRSTLPLTQANLRTIDPTMPKSSGGSVSNSSSVRVVRQRLEIWGHYIEDSAAKTRHADFLEEVERLTNGDRHSAMRPESVEKAKSTYDKYKKSNEPTFFSEFWRKLLNEQFTPNNKENVALLPSEWMSEHIVGSRDQVFLSTCVVATTDATDAEKLNRTKTGMLALPQPDILYGLHLTDWCSAEQAAIIKAYGRYTNLSHDLVLPWFIVEAKGLSGNVEEGINQAARAGAVLNASWRHLDTVLGTPPLITTGADNRSHVFSLAMSTTEGRMSVHWAEVKDGRVVKFHTHFLRSYPMWDSKSWAILRHDIDNVLEWGLLKRKELVEDLLKKLGDGGKAAHEKSERLHEEEEFKRATKGEEERGSWRGQCLTGERGRRLESKSDFTCKLLSERAKGQTAT